MAPLPFSDRRVTVRVPATTANLGPGFDALGLALDWYDEVTLLPRATGLKVVLTGEGAREVPTGSDNLVVRGLQAGLGSLNCELGGVELRAHNTIPFARGLGSSSAAIVAGLALAWGLARPDENIDRDWAFDLAVAIEGHPDNVGPAVSGGLTIGWEDQNGIWRLASSPVSQDIGVTVLVPQRPLETAQARALMPQLIPLRDAVANSARTALLVRALAGDSQLLSEATTDYLHQEYRRPLYGPSLQVVDHLRAEGFAAYISGAGPTVAVFHLRAQAALVSMAAEAAQASLEDPLEFAVHALSPGDGVQIL